MGSNTIKRAASVLLAAFLIFAATGLGVARANDTTTTTSSTLATKRFTGGSLALLQLSENQFQVRLNYSLSGGSDCTPIGYFTETWSRSPNDGQWSIGTSNTNTSGSETIWWNVGACGTSWDSGRVFNAWGLKEGTTYTVSVTGGYEGNMITASRSITTLGGGWQTSSTTTTLAVGSSLPGYSSTSSSTTTTIDSPLYMAQIDSSNRVLQICVCSEAFVRANPSRYPGTWVPAWMGVGGKNYPSPGMIYDWDAQNFYWPTTTTTSTTIAGVSTTIAGVSTTTIAPSGGAVPDSGVSTTTVASVEPGSGEVVVGGATIETNVSIDTDAGVATVSAGGVVASLSGEQSEQAANVSDENSLVFNAGDEVSLNVSGFQPESEAEAIVYSEPRRLGVLQVDAQGNLNATVELPPDLESGNHTLVLAGVDSNGNPISVKFGLIVFGNDGGIPLWMWVLVGLLVAVLFTSVSLNLRQRGTPRPA